MPRWWRRVVDALQVETQGKYSAPRVAELAAYRRQTSTLEALAVLVLTTLPCVTVTVLMGAVPLARPAEGLDANWRFLLHLLVAFWLFAAIATVQFAHYLPSLPISGARIALHSVVVAVCSVGSLYAIGCATGFPVPFTFVVVTPVWAAVIVALLWIAWGRRIRANPALWRLIFSSFVVWVSQLLLTYIYPTYFYVYTLLPPVGRVGFAFLLPVIKLIVRAVLAQSVVHLRNELPEIIVFNAELFNSLFVMYCMQNSPSLLTTAGLMAVDFAQSALALHDINHIFKDIKALHTKANDLAVGTGRRRRDDFLEMAERILKDGQEQRVTSKRAWTATVAPLITSIQGRLSSQAWMSYGSRAQIFPLLQPTRRSTEATGSAVQLTFAKGSVEERYVDALLRLLYMTEFLMLLNYVEVIIPSIYSVYLVIVYFLPNRVYYQQIDVMTDEHLRSTLLSIFLYASLVLCSLLALHCMLVYKLKLPGLVQLAFVLRSQWLGVQSKLVFWLLFNALVTLQHIGSDFSFHFSWLHRVPSTKSPVS